MRELCERLGDPPELFPALFGLWIVYVARGELRRRTYELAEQLLRLAQSTHEPALLLYARTLWELPRTGEASSHPPENISKTRSPSMILSAIGRSSSAMEGLMPGYVACPTRPHSVATRLPRSGSQAEQ